MISELSGHHAPCNPQLQFLCAEFEADLARPTWSLFSTWHGRFFRADFLALSIRIQCRSQEEIDRGWKGRRWGMGLPCWTTPCPGIFMSAECAGFEPIYRAISALYIGVYTARACIFVCYMQTTCANSWNLVVASVRFTYGSMGALSPTQCNLYTKCVHGNTRIMLTPASERRESAESKRARGGNEGEPLNTEGVEGSVRIASASSAVAR